MGVRSGSCTPKVALRENPAWILHVLILTRWAWRCSLYPLSACQDPAPLGLLGVGMHPVSAPSGLAGHRGAPQVLYPFPSFCSPWSRWMGMNPGSLIVILA